MTVLILAQSAARQREVLRQMGSRFRAPDPELYWKVPFVLGLLAVALLLVGLLVYLERRRIRRQDQPQPMRLFVACLLKLDLPWRDCWRLWRLAGRLRIKQPATLLISPVRFDAAVARDVGQPAAGGRAQKRSTRFAAIRGRLFPSPPPSISPAQT